MNALQEKLDIQTVTVADLARLYPGATEIFDKYNIDYCCGGRTSLINACAKASLNTETVLQEIIQGQHSITQRTPRFDSWEPTLLINFIVQHHHAYVRESIPTIQALLHKVCQVHGSDHPALEQVRNAFQVLSNELLQHLQKEETVLFPLILKMYTETQLINTVYNQGMEVERPMVVMEDEHELAGNLLKTIRALSDNYQPPSFACPTFQLTYRKLQEFDHDLMQHIHLENNVLFPRIKKQLHSNETF